MRHTRFAAFILAAVVSSMGLVAQTAKQDMKDAGHDTAQATKNTGHAIGKGTEKGYDKTKEGTTNAAKATGRGTKKAAVKTKDATVDAADATAHGTKVAAHKTANGTKKLADKVSGKD